jgi:hypothetical protein
MNLKQIVGVAGVNERKLNERTIIMDLQSTSAIRGQVKATETLLAEQKAVLEVLNQRDGLTSEVAALERQKAGLATEIERLTISRQTVANFEHADLLRMAEDRAVAMEVEKVGQFSAAARDLMQRYLTARGWINDDPQIGERWREGPGMPVSTLQLSFLHEQQKVKPDAREAILRGLIGKSKLRREPAVA